MNPDLFAQTEEFIARLDAKFGHDPALVARLRPVLVRVFESGPDSRERRSLLRLVAETYARHVRMSESIAAMRERLFSRVNDLYGRMLGIQPYR